MITKNKRTVFKLVTLVVFPVAVMLMLEVILGLFGNQATFENEDPFLGFNPAGSLYELHSDQSPAVYATRPAKLAWFNYQEFLAHKPENEYRIFCFGGSTTFGRPYSNKTAFSNWLQILLQQMDPGRKVEVINAGGVSYASYRIVNLMQEMVRYQPDLFIVYTGHNEFLEHRTYHHLIERSPLLMALQTQLYRLRSYSLVRSLWLDARGNALAEKKFQMSGEVETILDRSFGLDRYHRDPEWQRDVLTHFRLNLLRMIEIAHSHQVELVFVVPPSNEKDFSPFKSEPSGQLSNGEVAQWEQYYHAGQLLLSAADIDGAISAFSRAAALDSDYADLHFRLGQALSAKQDLQRAKREFQRALELDVAPLRATPEIQAIVRTVARQHRVPVVDLAATLEDDSMRRFGDAALGAAYFLDHAHPTIAVHQLLAEELVRTIVQRHWLRPPLQLDDFDRAMLYDSVMATVDSVQHGLRDLNLAKVLDWAGKKAEARPFVMKAAQVLVDHPEAQYLRGAIHQEDGELEEAFSCYQKAIALDSGFAKAHNAIGTIYEKRNQLRLAEAEFRTAIRLREDYDHAYFNLGQTLFRMNRIEAALQSYQKALAINPYHAKALNNLGGIYLNLGMLPEAKTAFNQVLQLDHTNKSAYSNLGILHYQRGEFELAREMFNQVLEIAPGDEFAMRWLARVPQDSRKSTLN